MIVLPTYFGPPTRQSDILAKRRDTLFEGTEAGLDQARRTVPRGIEAPTRPRAIAALVRPSVCNVLQRLQDRLHSRSVRTATERPLTNRDEADE